MSFTVEEMRQKLEADEKEKEKHQKWLEEECMVAHVTFPLSLQQALNCTSVCVRLEELADYLEEHFENEEHGIFSVKLKKKTNRWMENLPEADI
jgi:hypothetical protein